MVGPGVVGRDDQDDLAKANQVHVGVGVSVVVRVLRQFGTAGTRLNPYRELRGMTPMTTGADSVLREAVHLLGHQGHRPGSSFASSRTRVCRRAPSSPECRRGTSMAKLPRHPPDGHLA